MDAFAMKKSCSSKDSSKSPASEKSHEVITNTKKDESKIYGQLKTHELSSSRALLDLKVHNDYNSEKNINCSNPEFMKEKIVEGYQWKTHELSEVVEEHLSLKVNNCCNNNKNINCSNLGLNLFNSTPAHASESSNIFSLTIILRAKIVQRVTFQTVFPNLKNVKIVISSGMCMKEHLKWEYNIKKLFKLSDFLLENAVVLEKFVIVSNRQKCEICGVPILWRLANKLRSSANSVIIFQE
ncbi:hypothetical protein H5410_055566 [Solanum commersonii]|uniref:Uncharacterized protein n=1 Tax=Solanum commersonii TaxID=4109 RepID=A0A9J5WK78_SOLCO|nr:hypothetical protein H5410_055566 [Solanum commersonii]